MYEDLKRLIAAASVATACLALGACGGNSDGPPPGDGLTDMQRADRDASASISGLFSFALGVITALTAEDAEPRAINGITPAIDDTAEPPAVP